MSEEYVKIESSLRFNYAYLQEYVRNASNFQPPAVSRDGKDR